MTSGIQGQLLEVTVVACNKLRNTEFLSRQDPYVCIEYANSKYRTRTCTDGGKNPTFQEKFQIPLIEGLREFTVTVWNSNTLSRDDFIGTGVVQLHKVLSEGYDDSSWPIHPQNQKAVGEVKLIMHFAGASKQAQLPPSAYPPAGGYPYSAPSSAPSTYPGAGYPLPPSTYPPAGGYPYSTPPCVPPTYPGADYPPPRMPNPYTPATYPSPSYPPYVQPYPPPSGSQLPYYQPPGPYPGTYPRPY